MNTNLGRQTITRRQDLILHLQRIKSKACSDIIQLRESQRILIYKLISVKPSMPLHISLYHITHDEYSLVTGISLIILLIVNRGDPLMPDRITLSAYQDSDLQNDDLNKNASPIV